MRSNSRPAGRVTTTRWVLAALAVVASCVGDQVVSVAPVDATGYDLKYPPASVTVDPATVNATVGDSGGFNATVRDKYGRVLTTATVKWSSTDTTVVTIEQTGYARAIRAGTI